MEIQDVMRELEARGKPGTSKIYRRHGIAEDMFGVSYGELEKLVKQIGINQELALALWRTGNHDARVLATKIADPGRMTAKQIGAWLSEAGNYVITDAIAALAARMPAAKELAQTWIDKPGEWVSAAGWNVMGSVAMGGQLDEAEAARLIEVIQAGIHAAPNRTRYSMNNALIAIGGAMEPVRERALAAARAIGHVEVDHGETGCKTPEAVSYIERMAARAGARGKRAAPKAAPKAAKRETAKAAPKAAKRGTAQ